MTAIATGSSVNQRRIRAAQRQDEAITRLLAGTPYDVVRLQLKLTAADERTLGEHLRARHPWLAVVALPPVVDDDPFCPGVSPHPAVPTPDRIAFRWWPGYPGKGRLIAYTCDCVMTTYELLSYGGLYRVRRLTTARRDAPSESYTGGWRRGEATEWWHRLLAGKAR